MMPLSVVHVIGNTVIGGSEMHLVSLVDGLRRTGIEVPLVVTPGNGPLTRILRQRSIPFQSVGFGSGDREQEINQRAVDELKDLFTRLNPDLVHCHLYPAQVHATLAAYLAGIPALTTIHRLDWLRPASILLPRLAGSSTIAVCSALADALVRVGVPKRRLEVVYNAVASEHLDLQPAAAAELRLELAGESAPVIGTVVRLSEEKGVDVLLQAFPKIAADFPDARLLVAGHGPLAYKLRNRARELGTGDRTLLGTRHDVHLFNQALDLFVLPSRSEAFPLALLEAMAVGKACVATKVGGIPEMVSDGAEGLLVPPDDPEALAAASLRLLRDPGLSNRLGEAARQKVRRCFTLDQMVEETVRLYRRLGRTRLPASSVRSDRYATLVEALERGRTAPGSLSERVAEAEASVAGGDRPRKGSGHQADDGQSRGQRGVLVMVRSGTAGQ